jgi:hypothetical protein
MNFLARQLEAYGQTPQTFWRDAFLTIARFIFLTVLVMVPVWIYFALVFPQLSTAPPGGKPQKLTPQIALLLLPFFLYLPLAVFAVLSVIGGWRRLARQFRAPKNFKSGQLFRWQNAQVGGVNFNNSLNVRVASEGLHLSMPILFSFMHPPLLIPWIEIKAARQRKLLFRSALLLTIGQPKIVTIAFPESRLTQAILPYVQSVIIEAPT